MWGCVGTRGWIQGLGVGVSSLACPGLLALLHSLDTEQVAAFLECPRPSPAVWVPDVATAYGATFPPWPAWRPLQTRSCLDAPRLAEDREHSLPPPAPASPRLGAQPAPSLPPAPRGAQRDARGEAAAQVRVKRARVCARPTWSPQRPPTLAPTPQASVDTSQEPAGSPGPVPNSCGAACELGGVCLGEG